MPIRWRLTLWFAFVLGIILALSGVVLHVLLEQYLIGHIDNELRAFTSRIHGTVVPNEIPAPVDYDVIHSRLPPINEFVSPVTYIQLIDARGAIAVKSDSLGQQELPVDLALIETAFADRSAIKTVLAGDGAPLRVMVSPMHLRDQTLVLEVAQSVSYIETTMGQVRLAVLASVLLALVAATVSGGIIVRKALSPVSRITRTAQGIESGSEFYFVHSYYPIPTEQDWVLGETEYANVRFASIVARANLVATQFHPEKSGRLGLQLLNNFVAWKGPW